MYDHLSPYEKELAKLGDSVSIIASLEISGKITPEEAYKRIKSSYKKLKGLRKKEKDGWN